MDERKSDEPLSLMAELRRRKVLYTAVAYGISAFAATEIATFLFENLGAPEWADRLLASLFVAGFPVAMFLSWAFDIGADGVVRASTGDRRNRWRTIALAVVLLVAATGGLFYLVFPEPRAPTVADGSSPGARGPGAGYGFEPAEKLENSIAVLPFENLSVDPEDAFFSRGVAEEVLNHLGAYGELNIIGRTSSFAFEDSELPATKISALLGVHYLLQGSVRRHENQVRISTQLLDENGVQLWSRSFDRRLTDIFAIQTEIAVAVAEAVVPEITARAPEVLATSLDAYDHYLKGRDLLYGRQESAIDELERAIELDPGFAPAYAELAIALAMPGRIEPARQAAEKALSLQPGLLRGLAAQGLILEQQRPPDWPAAEAVLRRVLAQDPNMTDAIMWLSISLRQQGREDEADELMARALRVDPLHPTLSRNAATAAAQRGEDRRAIAIARRVIASPENQSYHPYVALFDLYTSRGRLVDAARVAREWTDDSARREALVNPCYCLLIWAHSLLGDRALEEYWLERSYRDFPGSRWTDIFNGLSLRWQGRYRDALDATNDLYRRLFGDEENFPTYQWLKLGVLEALSGDYSPAIEKLASRRDTPEMSPEGAFAVDELQALAWAYAKTGQDDRAELVLLELEDEFEKLRQEGTLFFQIREASHGYALNAALLGDDDRALDRLEAIIDSGWRGYYVDRADPRWGALRDHPRFQALMEKVKADVDRQRAELESSEPHEAFVARLDAIMSAAGESTP